MPAPAEVGKFRSLSTRIALAMCSGLLLPAMIGGVVLSTARHEQMAKELEKDLEDEVRLLERSLADPVWNVDTRAAKTIIAAALQSPQIVRISISDPRQRPIVSVERPERRIGASHVARRELKAGGEMVGTVELEIDDGLRRRELEGNRQLYYMVLLGQFALALGLILFELRRRVLRPLNRLATFSNQLAGGDLERPLDWNQSDEIGRLASQMDQMRSGLRTSFAEQQAILDNVQVGVIFVRERTIQLANSHAERIFGYGSGELKGLPFTTIFLSEDQSLEVGAHAYAAIATAGGLYEEDLRLKRHDGGTFWARMRGCAMDPEAPHDGSIWVFEDVTQRRLAADQLRLSATVFENTADGVIITDQNRNIVAVNTSFQRITGYSEAEMIGKTPSILSSGRQGPEFYAEMWHSLNEQHRWRGEIWNRRKNGEIYPEQLTITKVFDESGMLDHYVGVFSDITAIKESEQQLEFLAFHDPLTHLPNRRLLLDRLQQALITTVRSGRFGALLFIDLDDFKTLNDTLGHDHGDLLLREVGQRLVTFVRAGDTVARLGGDEFVVMLEDLSDNLQEAATQAEAVGQKVLAGLNQPYLLAGCEHRSTPSIGLALISDQMEAVDELLKRADLAMYSAKAAGRNTLRFFDPAMQDVVTARAVLDADLREGMRSGQFVLFYQPQVDRAGRISGAEALVRWQHPERGCVSPADFIPFAETTGLILPLGHWVLETACAQLATWANVTGMTHLTIAVNVSARQFRHPDFVDQVLAILDHTGAQPVRLKLELTESVLLDDVEDIISKMTALKARGVGFSLDDFGTGYSSLSYLKRLPLDQLKIDQSFVRDLLTDPNDEAIARTIVALAASLGLTVMAEGVELEAQRELLAQLDCHCYQGYLFSRPVPIDVFDQLACRQ